MAAELSISEWTGWAGGMINGTSVSKQVTVSEKPAVDHIPPMLRRRLNLLGRACASEILRHTEKDDVTPIVYCSRHGDIDRTLSVLQELSTSSPVSPMSFSLAVHNAICGVASIHQQLKGNISTIAAEDGLVAVLLEAAGLLNDGHERVLCLIADTCLPDIYRTQIDSTEPGVPYAVCFVASRTGAHKIRLTYSGTTEAPARDYPAHSFLDFLDAGESIFAINHNTGRWDVAKI